MSDETIGRLWMFEGDKGQRYELQAKDMNYKGVTPKVVLGWSEEFPKDAVASLMKSSRYRDVRVVDRKPSLQATTDEFLTLSAEALAAVSQDMSQGVGEAAKERAVDQAKQDRRRYLCGGHAMERSLSFRCLRAQNLLRLPKIFHPLDSWTPADWACALAGECGELCNKIKKMRRGTIIPKKDVADEFADLLIYADLLAARLKIDLGAAVVSKFNEVSRQRGSEHLL